ncbi:hypothetical protein OsI_28906 [Oryza sativa Indica Group]|uniref:Uncharacterized protein n=1 Tax=Oryza sativa subsp. indica TaxID=39946 RepID=B8B9Z6_ORYSI|nr:hypothetical protein OsI_28906 [Oryza sativa Indica Group]
MFPGLIHHHRLLDADVGGGGGGSSAGLVLTADPKPRLRWTADLHDRFVDAVAQLGGPDTTPRVSSLTEGIHGVALENRPHSGRYPCLVASKSEEIWGHWLKRRRPQWVSRTK